MPEPAPAQQHAIIGCARSGTRYVYEVLKRLGADVKHESDRDNTSDQKIIVSGAAAGCPSVAGVEHIYHQIRDPIKVISSAQTLSHEYWDRVSKVVDIELDDPLPVLAARWWLRWNEWCEPLANRRYRVEQLEGTDFFNEWCSWLGVLPDLAVRDSVPRNHNTRSGRYRELTYENLAWFDEKLAEEVKAKGREYGYDID